MSNEAITWALSLKVDRSSAKFVLVAMANLADDEMVCWPSIQYLSDATSQDRKTVLENIRRLKECGLIVDTGMRRGGTGQVPVYRLNSAVNGTVKQSQNRDSNAAEADQKTGNNSPVFPREPVDNSPKQSQKRDSIDSETGPKTDGNSPVFPVKQSRFSAITGPKTGHGHHKDTSLKPNEPGAPLAPFMLPKFIQTEKWQAYLGMRKRKRNEPTDDARDLIIEKLTAFHAAGHDITAVLENSIRNGYPDVYAPKQDQQPRGSPNQNNFVAKPILPIEEQLPSLKATRGPKPVGLGALKALVKTRDQDR